MTLLLCLIETGHAAIVCKLWQVTQDYINLPGIISVPNEAQKGTVLWRSPLTEINLKCNGEMNDGWTALYLQLNPGDRTNTSRGPHVEMGINHNGQDYICSSIKNCRIPTGKTLSNCNALNPHLCVPIDVPIAYSVIIIKKVRPVQMPAAL